MEKVLHSSGRANPWNAAHKLANGRLRNQTSLTTLKKSDRTYTKDIQETITHMLNYLTPEDDKESDNKQHQQIRREIKSQLQTPDDKEFTQEEILTVIQKFNHAKAPGEDGITSDIIL